MSPRHPEAAAWPRPACPREQAHLRLVLTFAVPRARPAFRSQAHHHAATNTTSCHSAFLVLDRHGLVRGPAADRIRVLSRERPGHLARAAGARSSRAAARAAEERVLGEIDRLAAIFNGYDPESELSRWQDRRAGSRNVSPELFEVLEYSDSWTRKTAGAFDPRGSPDAALVVLCPAGPPADAGRAQPRQSLDEPAGVEARPWHPDRRTSLRLPDQLERHRQGLHRRPGLGIRVAKQRSNRRTFERGRRLASRAATSPERSASRRHGPIRNRAIPCCSSRSATARFLPAEALSAVF